LPIRIALDLDGVLSDSMGRWLEIWNSRHAPPILTVDDLGEWDFWRRLSITQREFNRIFDEVWRGWEAVRPLEEGIGGKVARLARLGRVDIVSGRATEHLPYVKSWLRLHRVKYSSILLGASPKSRLGHDVFIDDSPVEAVQIARTGRYVLLRDQPWNRGLAESVLILRVRSLDEAFERLVNEVLASGDP